MKFNHLICTASVVAAMSLSLGACKSNDAESAAQTTDNSANAAIECIMTRSSVREYDPEHAVSADTIETILRAAMAAPTAVNSQPWEFIVVNEREALDSLSAALPRAKMLSTAPLAIVTCGNLGRALQGEGQGFWIQDVSAATENLLLAAHALGLGAVWTGVYPSQKRVEAVQKHFNLPDSIIPLAVVPMGYPVAPANIKDKWKPEYIHNNRW